MPVKINYSKNTSAKPSGNYVFYVNDKFNISQLTKYISKSEINYIGNLLRNEDLKKNILVYEINSKRKIILISIKNNLKTSDIEALGAEFYGRINYGKNDEYFINSDTVVGRYDNFLGYFLHGLKLKSYEFKKYKTKKRN